MLFFCVACMHAIECIRIMNILTVIGQLNYPGNIHLSAISRQELEHFTSQRSLRWTKISIQK